MPTSAQIPTAPSIQTSRRPVLAEEPHHEQRREDDDRDVDQAGELRVHEQDERAREWRQHHERGVAPDPEQHQHQCREQHRAHDPVHHRGAELRECHRVEGQRDAAADGQPGAGARGFERSDRHEAGGDQQRRAEEPGRVDAVRDAEHRRADDRGRFGRGVGLVRRVAGEQGPVADRVPTARNGAGGLALVVATVDRGVRDELGERTGPDDDQPADGERRQDHRNPSIDSFRPPGPGREGGLHGDRGYEHPPADPDPQRQPEDAGDEHGHEQHDERRAQNEAPATVPREHSRHG